LAAVHPRNQTPAAAVISVGIATGLCMFLGSAILVPITDVGSLASALGWFAACAAYLWMRPPLRGRMIGSLGALVGLAMVMMKVLPFVPGHFTGREWLWFGLWVLLGILIGRPRGAQPATGENAEIISNSGKNL
jgi:hypothetical protein